MPSDPIYTCVLLCERIITEEDGVRSAFRIIDTILIPPMPDIPPERRPITLHVLVVAKFHRDDEFDHKIEFRLERPDGGVVDVAVAASGQPPSSLPGAITGVSAGFQFGVIPREMGVYYMLVDLDGTRIARAPFTLREIETEVSEAESE
jgi:hypothetical protein